MWLENPHISREEIEGKNQGISVLLNDTIGFIRDLPPDLIAAFTSTLEDSVESDVLLHVVDAGDPWIDDKIAVVREILSEIGADNPTYMVFNKSDLLSTEEMFQLKKKYTSMHPIFVSAESGYGIADLKKVLSEGFICE